MKPKDGSVHPIKHQPRCYFCDAPYTKIAVVKMKMHFVCGEHAS